jgi:lysophospholipase L1-like esterase
MQRDLLRIQSGIAKENDIKVINLHAFFYKAKKSGVKTFYDNIHLTPEGNKLISRRLASYIEQEFNR